MMLRLQTAGCLTDLPAHDVSIRPLRAPTNGVVGEAFEVSFAVDFNGDIDALDVRVHMRSVGASIETLGHAAGLYCSFISFEGECHNDRIPPRRYGISPELTLIPLVAGRISIDVSILVANDYNVTNNFHTFVVEVEPAVTSPPPAPPPASRPPSTSGGGGGGATDLFLMLALIAGVCLRPGRLSALP
jgi:hypothetical protein